VTDEHDETIERIASALRPLPEVDASAKARLLVAVAAERAKAAGRGSRRVPRSVRWTAAIVGLAAAGGGAFAVLSLRANVKWRGSSSGQSAVGVESAGGPSAPGAHASPAAAPSDAATLMPVQLVLRATDAHRVSVVGDFTGWDERRAPMTRDPASGLWSITLALRPGRHVYAYLVDDSIWVRDPRAPVAVDADFGRPGSVLLVGRP
jgi:hypothetical protein